ncbi:hypothetical protein GGS24DRAFT_451590 [Hypoxylon argillaceum]|nr:hypothetical protein GGS24DRAFT_451590 [Hypoxylon argillaceum]
MTTLPICLSIYLITIEARSFVLSFNLELSGSICLYDTGVRGNIDRGEVPREVITQIALLCCAVRAYSLPSSDKRPLSGVSIVLYCRLRISNQTGDECSRPPLTPGLQGGGCQVPSATWPRAFLHGTPECHVARMCDSGRESRGV